MISIRYSQALAWMTLPRNLMLNREIGRGSNTVLQHRLQTCCNLTSISFTDNGSQSDSRRVCVPVGRTEASEFGFRTVSDQTLDNYTELQFDYVQAFNTTVMREYGND